MTTKDRLFLAALALAVVLALKLWTPGAAQVGRFQIVGGGIALDTATGQACFASGESGQRLPLCSELVANR